MGAKNNPLYDISKWIPLAIIFLPAQKMCILVILILSFLLIKMQIKCVFLIIIHDSEELESERKIN